MDIKIMLNFCWRKIMIRRCLLSNSLDFYDEFVQEKVSKCCNEHVTYVHNFVTLANKCRLFWNSARNGDRVAQKHVMLEFLDKFLLLKKQNTLRLDLIKQILSTRTFHIQTWKRLEWIHLFVGRLQHTMMFSMCLMKKWRAQMVGQRSCH